MNLRLVLAALLLTGTLSGQNFNDALRYSFVTPQGTARFAGTGGSLTPLGVDVTTLHTNPAGIGWNRYNVAQVTPGFTFTGMDANLVPSQPAENTSESAANFNLPSIGAIFAGTTRSVNWSTLNFGISVTRLTDYNQQTRFGGRSQGSIIDGYAADLNAGIEDPFGSLLAFNTGAFFEDDQGFFTDFDFEENDGGRIRRDGLYDRRGSMSEVALGFGGNYREKLLWGLSFGIPFFTYDEVFSYEEVDDQGEISGFDNSAFDQSLITSGTGFNLKFGLTYLPTEQLRISGAIHSPTLWTIDEQFSTGFEYNFVDDNGQAMGGTELSPLNSATYNLSTPWRFMVGAGYLIGKSGFLSVDVDYADYRGNSISFDDFATAAEATNESIDNNLSSSIGLRVGGELNLKPIQLRAGVGYRQIPYAVFLNDEDEAYLTYSAGAGYSIGKFFVDVAAQYSGASGFETAYNAPIDLEEPLILTDRSRVSVLLTVGLRGFNVGF
ncbi:hypothetical protein LEM8419_02337 [Neolewinella maritima]|uniref:Uncharacterized protein n=1 Tax=Neolewinella maritima TaxID=1383882 RepID=A0ABM9B287_9BACT|nr:hypothetical protein [Neolewinella maritima]CAH1001434.1 hypothetical protein LEM8419_02337 [Neolewinella maritima]